MRFLILAALCLAVVAPPAAALPPVSTSLAALSVSATTGEKPQSKVWSYAGKWWCVMPNSGGTWVWRLDGTTWTSVLKLSNSTGVHADVKALGSITHVLLFNVGSSELASIEYVPASQTYQAWTTRPGNVALTLDSGVETATIDVDSQGRMWLATDHAAAADQIVVYYSDAPYSSWSGPVTLATGINGDDISVVTAMPGGKIGVMWSNQNTQRFGFRTHVDGTDPTVWTADEVPVSQSALNVGAGMADDHLHVAVGSDGTLYAAVKTSYDTGGYPKIALLVRRPAGTWDNLYEVDQAGTRGIVLLDESAGTVAVVYTTSEGAGNIIYKESATSTIAFGTSSVLISGSVNDATSTKQNIAGAVVILAGNGSSASGVLRSSDATYTITASAGANGSISPSGAVVVSQGANQAFAITANGGYHVSDVLVDGGSVGAVAGYTFTNVQAAHTIAASFAIDVPAGDLVGRWPMDEGSGSVIYDASSYHNDGTLLGSPTWTAGVSGQALVLNGTSQYASVPHSTSLDITGSITLAAWVKTTKVGTQNIIAKALYGGTDGYELNLSSGAKPFLRLNGLNRLDALTSYTANTWTHVAATYDGVTMKIYVNGALDNSAGTSISIKSNSLALGIGAQSDGRTDRLFSGAIDDARVYSRALSATEIAALASLPSTTHTITASAGANGSISPSGAVSVNDGASQTFSITANTGYHVADVLVDGGSVGTVTGYTFTNVIADHTIAASFAADVPTGDLVGWWQLDSGVSDASTYGNSGTLPNGGSWVSGVESQGLSLNGSSQYVSVPHSTSLDLTSAVTLAAWIKPTKLATQAVIAKEVYGTSTWGYALELSSVAPGQPFFRLDGNAAGTSRLNAITAYPQDGNTWTHVAATFDGTTMKIYINGVLDASQSHPVSIPQNTQPLAIGSQSVLESGRLFSGAIDEARVYNRALSASEVAALMNHSITASAGAHGAISPAGAVSVAHGGSQIFSLTPDPGYRVADVLVDGITVGAVTSYTFTNVVQSHTITASFTANAPPDQPALAAPADLATGVAPSPTLDVVPTDPDSPQLTLNFYGRAVNGPPGPDFTVVALPDAQNYTGQVGSSKNAMYKAQTQWCVSHRVARRIAYVAQLGDCAENASVQIQWMRSDTTFRFLEDPVSTGLTDGIPYGIAVGNHDQYPKDSPDNSTQNYNQWFGSARFQGRGYYGGHFADNNDTWFNLFSASGMDFIVVSLEIDPTPDANRLSWADSILKVHSNRRAIVVSHSIIGPGGGWEGPGQTIYNALKNNPNLFLMLCGHVGDQGRRQDVYNGHTVHSLLSDYQGWSNGGDGWLRYMEFSPANNVIRVRTYTPWLAQYKVTADSSSQFTLPYDMSGTSAYQLIGTVTNVASGAHATITWPGLAPGTQYEWYVTVSDGAGTTTSAPTWRFTTASGGTPPAAVTDLSASPATSGNDGSGRTRIALIWSGAEPGVTAQVYRKGYGDYPTYREGVGAAPAQPASPAAAEAAGWTLVTGVTASRQTDQPPVRNYWYYVLFLTAAGGSTSPVSNLAGGALDYLLGDVSDGISACAGNNAVNTADISLLGAQYGVVISGPSDPNACLDVGPTVGGSLTGRPRPDGVVQFEDLVMFALNYTGPGGPGLMAARAESPTAAAMDALELHVPALPRAGETFSVVVRAWGKGDLQAVSLMLAYDRSVVEMVSAEGGELLSRQGAQSVLLTPKPGRVDVALLGNGAGLLGEGELAIVRFRALAAGEAKIRIASADGRDARNQKLALSGAEAPAAPEVPAVTQLAPAKPNPFLRTATITFSLAVTGPVELAVYSVDGRKVRTLAREVRGPGEYHVVWDGRNEGGTVMSAGVYYACLITAQGRFTRTLTYLK